VSALGKTVIRSDDPEVTMSRAFRSITLGVAIAVGLVACGGGGGHPLAGSSGLTGAATARPAAPPPGSPGAPYEPGPAGGSGADIGGAAPAPASAGGAGLAAASTAVGSAAGSSAAAARPANGARSAAGGAPGPVAPARATSNAAGPPAGEDTNRGLRPAPAPTPGTPAIGTGPGDTTGVTPTEIVFGMHLPQSGPTGVLIGNGWKGADAYFRSINEAGGINGRRLKLVVADDRYSSQGAATAIRELVDVHKVFAVGCPVGADQCSVGVTYANSKGVPYISGGFREQYLEDKPWAFPVTASYGYAGARLVDYLFEKRGYTPARKLGFFYLHSENFDELVQRADQAMARHGARFTVKYPAEKDQSDFSAAVTKMQSAGVDTVWFHTAPDLITKFAAQAKILGFQPQYVFIPPAGGDIFAAAAGGNLDKAFGLAAFDDPEWPGAARFRDMFHRYYPNDQVDEFNLLCYIVSSGFVEGIRRAGPDLGRDALARGLGSIDHLDTGVSQPVSFITRGRTNGPNSTFAIWEIHGTDSVQTTGFDW